MVSTGSATASDTAQPHARGRGLPRNQTLVAFIALALTWGASFLFIKTSLDGLAPVQVAAGRVTLGALTLVTIMTVTRRQLPRRGRLWMHLVIGAIPLCVLPMLLYSWASQYLPSSLESIYNATTPLMTMAIALVAQSTGRPTRSTLNGLLLGAVGVIVVLGPWTLFNDSGALKGTGLAQLACLAATFCYGVAYNYTRRYISPYGIEAIPIAAAQIGSASVMLWLLLPIIGFEETHLTWQVVLSMLALGAIGTGLAYGWNNTIIQNWGPTNASTVTYFIPIVGVLLGVVVLGEKISWNQPVGAVVVVLGIILSQGRLRSTIDTTGRWITRR